MPLTTPVARDGFNSADTNDIDARALDGDGTPALAAGTWAKLLLYAGAVGIRSSHATGIAGGYRVYTVGSVPDFDDVAHAAEALCSFPSFDTTPHQPYCTFVKDKTNPGSGNPERYVDVNDTSTVIFDAPGGLPPGTTITFNDADSEATLEIRFVVQADGVHVRVFYDWTGPTPWAPYFLATPSTTWTNEELTAPRYGAGQLTLGDCCNYLRVDRGATALAGWEASWFDRFQTTGGGHSGWPGDGTGGLKTPTWTGTGGLLLDRIDDCAPPLGGPAGEQAYVELRVRASASEDTAYLLGLTFSHFLATPKVELDLWEAVDQTYRLLKSTPVALDAAHDTLTALRLEVTAANVLSAIWGGSTIFTFDLTNDLAEEDDLPATMIPNGLAGFVAQVNPAHLDWMEVPQYTIYVEGDDEPCIEQPPYPPPPLPPTNVPGGLTVWKNGAFRFSGEVWRWTRGKFEKIIGPELIEVQSSNVWRNGLFRELGLGRTEDQGDPGEGPPGIICDDSGVFVPPTDPVDPIGARIFYCYNLPKSLLDPATPFETYFAAFGSASSAIAEINAAAAGGYRLMGQWGGYTRYMSGGIYSPNTADAFIDSFAGAASSAMQAAGPSGTGRLYGMIAFDDQASRLQWGTTIPGTEVQRVINRWKSVIPNVPIGVRLAPSQAIAWGGPLAADFYVASYIAQRGPVTTFRDREVAAAASLGRPLLFNVNVMNGGNGSSGLVGTRDRAGRIQGWQMSTAEVFSYGSVLCAVGANTGFGFWKYGIGADGASWIAQTGMMNTLVAIRNTLTAA